MSDTEAPPAPARPRYLPTLDGWRAIAILAVMVCHGSDDLVVARPSFGFLKLGSLGVDVFFGISGFLITWRLLEEATARGGISLSGFYIRRFFRILPPYATYLVILAALTLVGAASVRRFELLSCCLFFRNYLPSDAGGWYTGHFWSLAVEEHFYLLWPGLLVLVGMRRGVLFAALLSLGIAAWRSVDFRLHLFPTGASFFERTDVRLDGLLWGCFAALLLHSRPRLADFVRPWHVLPLGLAFLATLVFSLPQSILIRGVVIPAVLVNTVLHPRSMLGRILELRALQWVGRLSYSLYLWQQPFLAPRLDRASSIQSAPIGVLGAFAFAAASYYLIERPLIRAGRRLAGG